VDGFDLMGQPYRQRRRLLEELELTGPHCLVPESFEDGEALFDAVCEHGLEGVVAKKLSEPYRPGERSWVKRKNREYWRYPLERESAVRSLRRDACSELGRRRLAGSIPARR
jgi:ATP-dependent DNA ligase